MADRAVLQQFAGMSFSFGIDILAKLLLVQHPSVEQDNIQ
jgi:hypothetical protein